MRAKIDTLVTVFGGSGFLGRHVVRALARQDYRIRVAVRRPDLAGHLQPLGRVGQIHAVQANLRYPDSVRAAAHGAEAVINLVGILAPSGAQKFDVIHAEGARAVAQAAAEIGARLIHVSALGADPDSASAYARSKAAGEQAVVAALPTASILRPSLVFGPEDQFFNRFAAMARLSPALPLIGGGHTRFQPVFAGDVGAAVAALLDARPQPGAVYELGGPEIRSFRELMEYLLRVIERRRLLVPVPFALASFMAQFAQFIPGAPLTPDQVTLLRGDTLVSAEAQAAGRTLEGLGIAPTPLDAIVPDYLWRFRRTGEFQVKNV